MLRGLVKSLLIVLCLLSLSEKVISLYLLRTVPGVYEANPLHSLYPSVEIFHIVGLIITVIATASIWFEFKRLSGVRYLEVAVVLVIVACTLCYFYVLTNNLIILLENLY